MQKSPGHMKQYNQERNEFRRFTNPTTYTLGTVKIVVACEGHDVERVIQKEYGFKEYSIVASEEIGNYTSSEFTVDGELDEGEQNDVDDRKEMYMTRNYLNDLARQGKIQKGDYVVDTSW
jgi:hypothetical protein